MTFLELAKHRRAYDGKWEVIAKIQDHENRYEYTSDTGQKITYTPERWITIKVLDDEPITLAA
jgi:hypothetical protein